MAIATGETDRTTGSAKLVPTPEGTSITYGGVHLYSSLRPRSAAERRASAQPVQERTLYLVPSPLLWFGVQTLLARLPPDAHLLCVEANHDLAGLTPPPPPDARVTYVPSAEPGRAVAAAHTLGLWRFRRTSTARLSAGSRVASEWYASLERVLEREVQQYWRNRMTIAALGALWIRNLFTNLAETARDGDVADLRTDSPVLVVGAGPSLEDQMDWIRAHRQQLLLLAVDTAYPVLRAAGIVVDAVVVLEAQFVNIQDFVGYPLNATPAILDLTASPQVVRACTGPRFCFLSAFHGVQLTHRMRRFGVLPTVVPPLGSVGVAALAIAQAVTNGPIIVAGLDFAYPGGATHARGAAVHEWRVRGGARLSPAETVAFTTVSGATGADHVDTSSVRSSDVLRSYHEQAKRVLARSDRMFALAGAGMPLDIPAPGVDLLSGVRPPRPWPRTDRGQTADGRSDRAVRMVQSERRLLRLGTRHLDPGDDQAGRWLRTLDYLHFHFPDFPDPTASLASYLARVRFSATYYLGRLGTIIDGMVQRV